MFWQLSDGSELKSQTKDLISRMLDKNPKNRITISECLKHADLLDAANLTTFKRVIANTFMKEMGLVKQIEALKKEKLKRVTRDLIVEVRARRKDQ